MFYECPITVPAGATAVDPVRVTARLNKGVVTGVSLWFPPGQAGRAFVAIDRLDVQIWPSNPDVGFAGDGVTIPWDDYYQLTDEPLSFVLRGWAPDARFSHTVTVRFELMSLALAGDGGGPFGLLRGIADFLGLRG